MANANLGIVEGLAAFFALADKLVMPDSERQGILGVSDEGWAALASRRMDSATLMTAEFRRRLDYVLPLMRQAIANQGKTGADRESDQRPPNQWLS